MNWRKETEICCEKKQRILRNISMFEINTRCDSNNPIRKVVSIFILN